MSAPVLAGCLLAAVLAGPVAVRVDEGLRSRNGGSSRVRVETYDVSGESADELRRDLNRRGPLSRGQRYDARTDWHVRWWFDFERSDEGCRAVRPRVDLDVRITMPRWRQPAGASSELVERWQRYLVDLREHEDGHAAVGQSAADEIREALGGLEAADSCPEAERLANRVGHDVIERHNRKDERYDEETRHGATQGARFP